MDGRQDARTERGQRRRREGHVGTDGQRTNDDGTDDGARTEDDDGDGDGKDTTGRTDNKYITLKTVLFIDDILVVFL